MALTETKFQFTDTMATGSCLPADVQAMNRRGNFAGFKMPFEFARQLNLLMEPDPEESQRVRLVDDAGQRWRVVCSGPGADFSLEASVNKGAGRSSDDERLAHDQSSLRGYILCDVADWPEVHVVIRNKAHLIGVKQVLRSTFMAWFYGTALPF